MQLFSNWGKPENKEEQGVDLDYLVQKVQEWSKARGLDNADPIKQMVKLSEEEGELAEGILKGFTGQTLDSIGDMLVVLIILAQQLGLTLQQCLAFAYNQIKDRQGKTVNGVFIKQEDLPN